uniref:Chroparavirus methyltransferase domain-containing protein n=1 Tax=Chihuahua culicoides virus 1 TaxID=3239318 RepID=A0AB39JD29_9VIRU
MHALTRSDKWASCHIRPGLVMRSVVEGQDSKVIISSIDGSLLPNSSVPLEIVTASVLATCTLPRDSKFFDLVRSYLIGRMRAENLPLHHADLLTEYVIEQADKYAVATVIGRSVWDPSVNCRLVVMTKLKWSAFIRDIWLGKLAELFRTAHRNVLKYSAPWVFKTIRPPVYEYSTPRYRSLIGLPGDMRPHNPFSHGGSVSDAFNYYDVDSSTEFGPEQCNNIDGDQSTERSATAHSPTDIPDEGNDGTFDSGDAGSQTSPFHFKDSGYFATIANRLLDAWHSPHATQGRRSSESGPSTRDSREEGSSDEEGVGGDSLPRAIGRAGRDVPGAVHESALVVAVSEGKNRKHTVQIYFPDHLQRPKLEFKDAYSRCPVDAEVKNVAAQLQQILCRDRKKRSEYDLRRLVSDLIREELQRKAQPAATAGARVHNDARDGMAPRGQRTSPVRKVGKALPCYKANRAGTSARQNKPAPGFASPARYSQVFSKERNQHHLDSPTQHITPHRRVLGNSRPVRGGHRAQGRQVPTVRKRY